MNTPIHTRGFRRSHRVASALAPLITLPLLASAQDKPVFKAGAAE